MLSMSIIVAILITNFTLATMTRFAPQFNLFSIGINMSLIIGLILLYFTYNLYTDKSETLVQEGMTFLQHSFAKIK